MGASEMDLVQATNNANKQIAADTNQANKDIAQMNNDFNIQMLDKQIEYNKAAYAQQFQDTKDFTKEMWNMNNEYNSPANQMKRLEAAGINPYQALGAVGNGNASSTQMSSGQMSGINPPTATPYQAVGYTHQKPDMNGRLAVINQAIGGIDNAVNTLLKSTQVYHQNQGVQLDNEYKARSMASRIGSSVAGFQGQKLQNQYQAVVNTATPYLMNNQITNGMLQNVGQGITNVMLDTQLDFLPLQQRMQLGEYTIDIMNKMDQHLLNGKELEKMEQEILEKMEDVRGKKFTNEQNDRMKTYLDNVIKMKSYPSNPYQAGAMALDASLDYKLPPAPPIVQKFDSLYSRQRSSSSIPPIPNSRYYRRW